MPFSLLLADGGAEGVPFSEDSMLLAAGGAVSVCGVAGAPVSAVFFDILSLFARHAVSDITEIAESLR